MTPYIICIVLIIVYIAGGSYLFNSKVKEIKSEYEKRIEKQGGINISQAIQIEMHEETINQLRAINKRLSAEVQKLSTSQKK
jgi:predicted transglutaminase-like cysteine proteinase